MTAPLEETKIFCDLLVEQALENCQTEGYQAQFMPQVADARINGMLPWDQGYSAPSIRATGRTRQGNAVVVYAHIPNWLADPANIRLAKQKRLNNAYCIPKKEFWHSVDADGQTDAQGNRLVWVIDHNSTRRTSSGRIPIEQALAHPETTPFLGGEQRAQNYLLAHAKAYATNIVDTQYNNDLHDDLSLARFLSLDYVLYKGIHGSFFFGPILLSYGLSVEGDGFYGGGGRFLGMREKSSEGSKK